MARRKHSKRPDPPAGRGGRKTTHPWVWLVLAAAVFSAVAPLLITPQLSDEGVTVLGALRVARGEVPYRDFFSLITPLSFYFLAPFFKVFGETVFAVRFAGAAIGVTLLVLTWAVARRLVPHRGFAALPLAILCMAGTGAWPFPSHHWVSDILVLGSVLCGLRTLEEWRFIWALASGALAAASAWALQDQGGAFLLLVPLLWGVTAPAERRRSLLLHFLGGAAAAVLIPLVALVAAAGVGRVWSDLVRYPMEVYWTVPGNRLGLFQPLREVAQQWAGGAFRVAPLYTAAASVAALSLFALPFAALCGAAVVSLRREARGAAQGLVAAGALALALTAARRWAPINLMWGASLPAVLVAWFLYRWWKRNTGLRQWLPVTVALLAGGACLWVGVGRGVRALTPGKRFPVQTPAGRLYEYDPRRARTLQGLVDAVEAQVPRGAPLFCREVPLVNFLVRRANPSRYDLFFPPDATTLPQVTETLSKMEREKWEWVILPVMPLHEDQPFDRLLLDHYTAAWANERFSLWRRNDSASAPSANPP